ncbi:D-alanyl-D-alanine carboxypeptidase [Streptomyces sp. SID7805]|nr:D-alanyl-D-alanine carboxypeptidase [Streptomyces sp. SID7805]
MSPLKPPQPVAPPKPPQPMPPGQAGPRPPAAPGSGAAAPSAGDGPAGGAGGGAPVARQADTGPAWRAVDTQAPEAGNRTAAGGPALAGPPAAPFADRPAGPAAGVPDAARPQPDTQPPLDLLAQLTNTPAPPETPMRTAARRVKIWGSLAALLVVGLVVVQAVRPLPDPKTVLTAQETHTFDGAGPSLPWPTEGQAVVDVNGLGRMGAFGEMKPLPIGSVAKVMTTYLVLKGHPLEKGAKGPSLPVDQKAEDDYTQGRKEKESVVEVKKGQQISQREALEAVMLPSANNVARLLARWDAGSEEAFIEKMNATAKELGMTNTTYTDASGLKETTVSTAEDQVKLAKKAMADEVFREIAKMTNYTATTTSGTGSPGDPTTRTQYNFNKLVPMFGVVGIKTGSTTKAGGNLLFAAEKKVGTTTQLIVGAVFGQHKPNIIETATEHSKQLILAAGKELTERTVVKKGQVVGAIDDGLGGRTPVVATADMAVVGWPAAAVQLKLTDGGKKLPHAAKAGTEVGLLTAGSGQGEVKVPVALQQNLVEPSFTAKLTRLG